MQNPNTLATRNVLLRYMEFCSEERWAASWREDLEFALASIDEQSEIGAFRWLVEQAGGWWTWGSGDVMRGFIEGSYADLREQALAAGWVPSARRSGRTRLLLDDLVTNEPGAGSTDDPSWEAVARRLWRARYKLAQLLAIVIGLDALSIWLNSSENTALLVGAPITVLVLLPDPPLWRMPLRSRRHARTDGLGASDESNS